MNTFSKTLTLVVAASAILLNHNSAYAQWNPVQQAKKTAERAVKGAKKEGGRAADNFKRAHGVKSPLDNNSTRFGGITRTRAKLVNIRIKLGSEYRQYKSYFIGGIEHRVTRSNPTRTHRIPYGTVIRYDKQLGSGKVMKNSKPLKGGTYEFRRKGNTAYLKKIK